MKKYILPILAAAALAAGCGSSGSTQSAAASPSAQSAAQCLEAVVALQNHGDAVPAGNACPNPNDSQVKLDELDFTSASCTQQSGNQFECTLETAGGTQSAQYAVTYDGSTIEVQAQ